MTVHWHVVENTPGYLPDSDFPVTFSDQQAACDYARHMAIEAAESMLDATASDTTPATDSWDAVQALITGDPMLYRIVTDEPHDLGRVVEVIPCADEACVPDV